MSFEQLKVFLREHHHTQVRSWPTIYAGLHSDLPVSNPDLDAAYAPLAVAQARILETLIRTRQACLARLDKLFPLHPDHEIYNSLPKAGTLLAPALPAKLGDDRNRYPIPQFCKPWQAPAHLRNGVANIPMCCSAKPPIVTSAISFSNGRG